MFSELLSEGWVHYNNPVIHDLLRVLGDNQHSRNCQLILVPCLVPLGQTHSSVTIIDQSQLCISPCDEELTNHRSVNLSHCKRKSFNHFKNTFKGPGADKASGNSNSARGDLCRLFTDEKGLLNIFDTTSKQILSESGHFICAFNIFQV